MAYIYVDEYSEVLAFYGKVSYVLGDLVDTQRVAIGATSAKTGTAVNTATKFAKIKTDTACQYEIGGSTVSATSGSRFLAAGDSELVKIHPGQYVAVIQQQ